MNCAHVRGLIDAGPFVDYPRAHLERAREHAAQCDACRVARDASHSLVAGLQRMPNPSPRDLTGDVMARIARLEEARAASVPAPVPLSERLNLSPVATTSGGFVAALFASSMAAATGTADTGALAGAVALVVYVAGLFAAVNPSDDRNRSPRMLGGLS